jgi:hypothetical protein
MRPCGTQPVLASRPFANKAQAYPGHDAPSGSACPDNKIVLTRVGDRLSANGEAYWPGRSIMPADEGAFSGTAAPSGRRLHFAADPCLVDLTLAGEFRFADDNRMCGHDAAFSGIFIRRPEHTK